MGGVHTVALALIRLFGNGAYIASTGAVEGTVAAGTTVHPVHVAVAHTATFHAHRNSL